jgi:hypothetical protein
MRVEGKGLLALGHVGEGEVTLRRAKALAAELGAAPVRWRAGLALSRLLASSGRGREAAQERADVVEILEPVIARLAGTPLADPLLRSEPFQLARAGTG